MKALPDATVKEYKLCGATLQGYKANSIIDIAQNPVKRKSTDNNNKLDELRTLSTGR